MSNEKGHWKNVNTILVNTDTITNNEKKVLDDIIDSTDIENLELAKTLLRLKIKDAMIKDLNKGQIKAFVEIAEYFNDPVQDAVVLKGYAGTGKTYLVNRVIDYIKTAYPRKSIAVTAPTNKAVQVLFNNSSNKNRTKISEAFGQVKGQLTYSTIHKLMRLKEHISETGVLTFVPEGDNVLNCDFLIVDEVSMLADSLFKDLIKYKDKINIIFMGDPAQIPPIGKLDSIPFLKKHKYNFLQLELTEPMRQRGTHPILDVAETLRSNIDKYDPLNGKPSTILNNVGYGIVHIDNKTNRKKIKAIIAKLFTSDEFKNDSDYVKIIAWRNSIVSSLNKIVRDILFPNVIDRFVKGDKIIANKALFSFRKGRNSEILYDIKANTSDEFIIEGVKIEDMNFYIPISGGPFGKNITKTFKIWKILAKGLNHVVLHVIHEDSLHEYKQLLKEYETKAFTEKSYIHAKLYYDILKWNDNILYNYAITAHKSQGSTYKNVIFIEEDINKNSNIVERNRIRYTVYTRITDKLYTLC